MKTYSKKPRLTVFTFTAMALVGVANAVQPTLIDEQHMDKSVKVHEGLAAKKMLSEMTDSEKAALSNEEYQMLKELEMKKLELDAQELLEKPDLEE